MLMRSGKTGAPVQCWWECKIMQSLWKFGGSLRTSHRLTIWPSNSTPRYIPKKLKIRSQENVCTDIQRSMISNTYKVATTQTSTNRWIRINEMCCVLTMEGQSVIKRNGVLIHATAWVGLENMLSKMSQTQKGKYYMIPLLYVE